MKQTILTVVAVLAFSLLCALIAQEVSPPSAPPPGQPKSSLRATGLSIAVPAGSPGAAIAPLLSGTHLHFILSTEQANVISLDAKSCKIGVLRDDKGKDLLQSAGDRAAGLGDFHNVADDGKTVAFSVASPQLPSPGSTSLQIKGELVLRTGLEPKEADLGELALKKGTSLVAGPVQMTVNSVMQERMGRRLETRVRVEADQPLDQVRRVVFRSADGQEIPVRLSSEGVTVMMGRTVHNRTYALQGSFEKAKVAVSYYARTAPLTVPVEATVGLGL